MRFLGRAPRGVDGSIVGVALSLTLTPPPRPPPLPLSSYKAHFRWQHWAGPTALPPGLPTETDACASVTSAFLQVRGEDARETPNDVQRVEEGCVLPALLPRCAPERGQSAPFGSPAPPP